MGAIELDGVELTILMPCLNEVETIATCINKAHGFLRRAGITGEVLVADNGSSDGSVELAASLGARVVVADERGYGSALRAGIRAATGQYVIFGDADDSYDFSALDCFVSELRAGADLVMGNRFKGGIQPGAMPPLHRYFGNPVLSYIGRLFFRANVGDFHCGLRGFRRDAIVALGLKTSGMEFASEMVAKASVHGLKIVEVPTRLYPDGRNRPPHLRSWRDGWRHLRFMLLFSPRWLFLYPGFILFLVGIGGMAWIELVPRAIGGVTFDINTLVYCGVFAIAGVQILTLALFSNLFAVYAGMLPPDSLLSKCKEILRVEYGIVLGLSIVLLGVVLSVAALEHWRELHFGDLVPSYSLRIVVPAATALVIGLHIVFSSFFIGLLDFNTRD